MFAARAMMLSRDTARRQRWGPQMTAPIPAAGKPAKACSISISLCTGDGTRPTPTDEAAASIAVT